MHTTAYNRLLQFLIAFKNVLRERDHVEVQHYLHIYYNVHSRIQASSAVFVTKDKTIAEGIDII